MGCNKFGSNLFKGLQFPKAAPLVADRVLKKLAMSEANVRSQRNPPRQKPVRSRAGQAATQLAVSKANVLGRWFLIAHKGDYRRLFAFLFSSAHLLLSSKWCNCKPPGFA